MSDFQRLYSELKAKHSQIVEVAARVVRNHDQINRCEPGDSQSINRLKTLLEGTAIPPSKTKVPSDIDSRLRPMCWVRNLENEEWLQMSALVMVVESDPSGEWIKDYPFLVVDHLPTARWFRYCLIEDDTTHKSVSKSDGV